MGNRSNGRFRAGNYFSRVTAPPRPVSRVVWARTRRTAKRSRHSRLPFSIQSSCLPKALAGRHAGLDADASQRADRTVGARTCPQRVKRVGRGSSLLAVSIAGVVFDVWRLLVGFPAPGLGHAYHAVGLVIGWTITTTSHTAATLS